MIHTAVSIQQIIARVIRNTRIQDSSYIQDMNEWIPECMGYMRTRMELNYTFKDVEIEFHKGKLPCGLIHIAAVEHQGHRLKHSNTVKHYQTGHDMRHSHQGTSNGITTFNSALGINNYPEGNRMYGSGICATSLEQVKCQDIHPSEYYQIEMDYINTSMRDTSVRIHYLSQPMDKDGFPLVPDNENYKEALYYYVRAKMIGCGYKDTVYTERELMERYEGYAARAMGQIKYPSTDIMQSRIDTMVRFIPPQNYWENYFRTDYPEKFYDGSGTIGQSGLGAASIIDKNGNCTTCTKPESNCECKPKEAQW